MRDAAEIQRAHDLLVPLVTGEVCVGFGADERKAMSGQLDVLCWVLQHDHIKAFGRNLETVEEQIRRHGLELPGPAFTRVKGIRTLDHRGEVWVSAADLVHHHGGFIMRTCPFDGCKKPIPDFVFACREHWFSLTRSQKDRIHTAYRSYRDGDIGIERLRELQRGVLDEVRGRLEGMP